MEFPVKRFVVKGLILTILVAPMKVFAWDGWDYESGTAVEIDKGNLVRDGETIDFFDYGSGEYRTGTVENISLDGSSIQLEITDDETTETRTFDMESE